MASRRIRSPLSRSCRQMGVFQSAGAVILPGPLGQRLHLAGVEVVDGNRDTATAQLRDERGRLFDRLGSVVFGPL